jgi:polysaccharide export outer membrane protein
MFSILFLLIGQIANLCLTSCSTPKNITYFKDIPDTIKQKIIDMAVYSTPVIKPDDILQVTIQTLDPIVTTLLNQPSSATSATISTAGAVNGLGNGSGYLVDKNGNVILPLIGKITVSGKTTDQVRDIIQGKAAEYYKDPVVNVRLANFKVTTLGEVAKPSTYVMPNEKVTLLDAIGVAGDLTIYGKRGNVMLIRDNNGKKEFIRFNLNDTKIFSSPYFYLQQGDVVYVEPNKYKVQSTDVTSVRGIAILTSVLSLLIIIVSRTNF